MTDIERINALTTNARNTWFALLAALVFVGITLLGVEHIDFYGTGRATQLPLVGVSVPTNLFFYAAPILTVAIYAYFHLYLIRLWDALSQAELSPSGPTLGDEIAPWLITDTALFLRSKLRKEACTRPRALEYPSVFWNIFLAWLAGPAILTYLWLEALPARDVWMAGIAATMIIFALIFCLGSAIMLYRRMRDIPPPDTQRELNDTALWCFVLLLPCAFCLTAATWQMTSRAGTNPAPLNLVGEDLVIRPEGWVPYALAKTDFLESWCKRSDNTCTPDGLTPDQNSLFEAEWHARRDIALTDLKQPKWSAPNATPPDLRNAQLSGSFLAGSQLDGALMIGADLTDALLEDANLSKAKLEKANLSGAQMQGAILANAQLVRADLRVASLDAANLRWAQLERADLRTAIMVGTDLSIANLTEADLSYSLLSGSADQPNVLFFTVLSASKNEGGALRYVDFTHAQIDHQTDFRNVFMDGSVIVPETMREMFGDQCQSRLEEILSDEEFYGRWIGWFQQSRDWRVSFTVPAKWRNVTPIPPDPDCFWKR